MDFTEIGGSLMPEMVYSLYERLRPTKLEDFLGIDITPAEFENRFKNRQGPVLVCGQMGDKSIGLGKTSMALLIGSFILGVQIPHLSDVWNYADGKTLYGRHLNADQFDIRHFSNLAELAQHKVFIIDEAQVLGKQKITFLRGLLEKDHRATYILVTSDLAAFEDKGALKTRCDTVVMPTLTSENRATLAQRGWEAMGKSGAVPKTLLAKFEEYDNPPINTHRVVLDIVEKFANGAPADRAIRESRI
jgi:replication-associated recombination protein RarA